MSTDIINKPRLRQWATHRWLAVWILQCRKVESRANISNSLLGALLVRQMTANRSTSIATPSPKTPTAWWRDMRNSSNWSMHCSTRWNSIWLRRGTTRKWWKGNPRHWIAGRMHPRLMGTIRRARRYKSTCSWNKIVSRSCHILLRRHYNINSEKGAHSSHSAGFKVSFQENTNNVNIQHVRNNIPLPRPLLLSAFGDEATEPKVSLGTTPGPPPKKSLLSL